MAATEFRVIDVRIYL